VIKLRAQTAPVAIISVGLTLLNSDRVLAD
jgi:hypothetical protein